MHTVSDRVSGIDGDIAHSGVDKHPVILRERQGSGDTPNVVAPFGALLGVELVLRQAGLIDGERRSTWVYYWIKPEALQSLSELLNTETVPAPRGEAVTHPDAARSTRSVEGISAH